MHGVADGLQLAVLLEQYERMEVAYCEHSGFNVWQLTDRALTVSYMTHDGGPQIILLQVLLRLVDELRKVRHGHADGPSACRSIDDALLPSPNIRTPACTPRQ